MSSSVGQVSSQHFADDLLAVGAGDLVGDGGEVEELPDLHAVVDAEIVGHEADDPPDRHQLAVTEWPTTRPSPAVGRSKVAGNRGWWCLAGAVGPDEAEDLALPMEAQVINGDEVP